VAIEALKARVSQLQAAAGTPGDESGAGAPNGSSASGPPDTDTATTTMSVTDEEDADTSLGGSEVPASFSRRSEG
jgi:hypothetical protein